MGGDLSITSVTDNAAVDVTQMGAGLSLGGTHKDGVSTLTGGLGISGNYAECSGQSVTLNEQSGLFAGSDGLQVKVEDKTTLIGGALASTADPSKNAVTSGTIETKDVALGSSYDIRKWTLCKQVETMPFYRQGIPK